MVAMRATKMKKRKEQTSRSDEVRGGVIFASEEAEFQSFKTFALRQPARKASIAFVRSFYLATRNVEKLVPVIIKKYNGEAPTE
jgi:hypothetical protein